MRLPQISVTLVFLLSALNVCGQQFILFDETFELGIEEAIKTKSHLYVTPEKFGKETPTDWTTPIDYRNGTVHIRLEVIEKPKGGFPTNWSLCYIPNKGRKNGYGCTGTPKYTETGVYEKTVKMNAFWNHDSIVWTKGIKRMALVIKDTSGGQGHAHNREDHQHYFSTKIRVTMVQVAAGATYDSSKVPSLNK